MKDLSQLPKIMHEIMHNADSRVIGPMLIKVLQEFPQYQIAYRWDIQHQRLDMFVSEIRPDDENSQTKALAETAPTDRPTAVEVEKSPTDRDMLEETMERIAALHRHLDNENHYMSRPYIMDWCKEALAACARHLLKPTQEDKR